MNLIELDQQYVMHTYARNPVAVQKGAGALCYDADGNEYIDFTSGIGVNALGFCDAAWCAAVAEQAGRLQHTSNLFYTEPCVRLAEQLMKKTGYSRVFFGNSGAEANEGAIKCARKYSILKYGRQRANIVTLVNSFHGRTLATLSATGQEVFHRNFDPFPPGFVYAEANNLNDVLSKIDDTVCAVMLELIQGEGGVCPLEQDFVREVQRYCAAHDVLLIADEVQTGVGRTGAFLCSSHFGIQPDITTLAKGLGGGLPIGAFMVTDRLKDVLAPGDHASTFGGNPVVCAGALEVVKRLDDGFLNSVAEKGRLIRSLLADCNEVESITGMGLMIGIKLRTRQAKDVLAACRQQGLLVLTAKEKLRLLPPLTITEDEIRKGIAILKQCLNAEV